MLVLMPLIIINRQIIIIIVYTVFGKKVTLFIFACNSAKC